MYLFLTAYLLLAIPSAAAALRQKQTPVVAIAWLLAIVLLRLLETGINRFPQISSYYITLIWGAVLLLVMVLNYFVDHPIARKKRA